MRFFPCQAVAYKQPEKKILPKYIIRQKCHIFNKNLYKRQKTPTSKEIGVQVQKNMPETGIEPVRDLTPAGF